MKQIITVVLTVFIYIGSIGLIDTSIAADHHGKGNPKILFHGIDMDKEQREQVRGIMGQQMEKGKAMRESIKKGHESEIEAMKTETRERLASVLTTDQMNQFDKNAQRAEKKMSNKRGKKEHKHERKRGKKEHKHEGRNNKHKKEMKKHKKKKNQEL
jgi:hypothetical protein